MTYRLDPAVPLNEAVRLAAFGEIDQASASLTAAADRHTGIHDTRKSLKRLRSLLLLIGPGLSKHSFQATEGQILSTAKCLAPARDSHALFEALNKLERDLSLNQSVVQSLRGWLYERRAAAERDLDQGAAAEAKRGLMQLKGSFAALHLPDDFHPLAEGLWRCYRSARKAFRQAFVKHHEESFHDWRKGVQQHWRQMQLLSPCWPSELGARVEAARNLSQLLGEEHDIALLVQLVTAPTLSFAPYQATREFLKQCRKAQTRLRRAAELRGERLFAEPARSFAARIETYWVTAAMSARADLAETRGANVVPFEGGRSTAAR